MDFHNTKLAKLVACPNCKLSSLKMHQQSITCVQCGETFNIISNTPVLIKSDSPVLNWYVPKHASTPSTSRSFKKKLRTLYAWLKPEDRVWSIKSQRVIQRLLKENNPDADNNNVVLIGSGLESVYRHNLRPYKKIIRLGLAHRGNVEIFCDICDIPLLSNRLNLVLSSSVLEHVYNPEAAVKEMFRVLKPGGYVYAEVPFMRAYHMIPIDYQRFTISGIEVLFKRQGFTLISKGICSGPFTATVLFIVDFFSGLFSFKYIQALIILILSIILHPIKFLDRLFENSEWAEINACNFYYVGTKA